MSSLALNETTDMKSGRGCCEPDEFKVDAVFEELFTLLEEYSPGWYTEEQHNRAVAALMAIGKRNRSETYRLGMTA